MSKDLHKHRLHTEAPFFYREVNGSIFMKCPEQVNLQNGDQRSPGAGEMGRLEGSQLRSAGACVVSESSQTDRGDGAQP